VQIRLGEDNVRNDLFAAPHNGGSRFIARRLDPQDA